jgi:hypothetical protein
MEYLEFSTNRTWATVFVEYSYDSSTFYVNNVYVSVTQYTNTNRTWDGYIKVNGQTIYSGGDSFIPTTTEWYPLGISGSAPVTDTVTISFHKKNYSAFFAVAGSSSHQFSIADGTSQIVTTSSGGSGSGGDGDSGGSYILTIAQGTGTELTVKRTWDESGHVGTGIIFPTSDGYPIAEYPIVHGDNHEIEAKAKDGYELDSYKYDTTTTLGFKVTNLTRKYEETDKVYRYTLTSNGNARIESTATPKQYKLTISEGSGSNLTVTRISSNHKNGNSGQLANGAAIYHDDKLQITCDADTGYETPSIKIGNTALSNGGEYVVSGNTTVTSSASVKSYTLTLNAEDPGVTIAVSRTSSPLKGAANKTWTKYEEEASYNDIYYGDVLTITFSSDPEYKINNQQVNGEHFISGGTHTVADDVYIVAITELSGVVHIFSGSQFDNYLIYVFNGSTWDQYIPYVFDGTKWCICS